MADTDKTAVVQFKIREAEYQLLLRLRQLRNQANGGERYRLELEIDQNSYEIIDTKRIVREAFTIQ